VGCSGLNLWRRFYERSVYLKGEELEPRIVARCSFAAKHLCRGDVLEIGCSSGFGSTFIQEDTRYTGIDYNMDIVMMAMTNFGSHNRLFLKVDVRDVNIPFYDNIIAFEFLEHISFGGKFAQYLKTRCNTLICSVPYKEEKGHWGPHHRIHNLSEENFPGFTYKFISFDGRLIDTPEKENGDNLMLMLWER
jgi:cyclopropane fatty-acyl-phospholipid synthase-like methyltransferase